MCIRDRSDILINDIVIPVENASNISASTNTTRVFITIGEEEMKVIKKAGNNLTVERGRDGTTPASHLRGDAIGLITDADDVLIPEGDDFGFDGSTF